MHLISRDSYLIGVSFLADLESPGWNPAPNSEVGGHGLEGEGTEGTTPLNGITPDERAHFLRYT